MLVEEKKNLLYQGNMFWIYEAFKKESLYFDFDKPYTDKHIHIQNNLLIYECLMFNEDREDSLFVMQDGILYEYFSENKSELLYKLIQYYENRIKHNYTESEAKSSMPIPKQSPFSEFINKRFKYNSIDNEESEYKTKSNSNSNNKELQLKTKTNLHCDPELKFKSEIRANLYIVFKDKSTKWIYNYELKKLLFYLKFLPRAKEIKLLRLFPLSVKKIEENVYSHTDEGDQLIETKETAQTQQKANNSNKTEINVVLLKNYVKQIKSVFYDKYLLNLKQVDICFFILDGRHYLLDINNFIFEKFENKHVKLDSEAMFYKCVEKNKDDTQMVKNKKILGDVKKFYDSMINKYNELFHYVVSDDYLRHPEKDPTSDNVFKMLKPESPYPLSTLMKPSIKLKTFVKYATDNLWNEDNS